MMDHVPLFQLLKVFQQPRDDLGKSVVGDGSKAQGLGRGAAPALDESRTVGSIARPLAQQGIELAQRVLKLVNRAAKSDEPDGVLVRLAAISRALFVLGGKLIGGQGAWVGDEGGIGEGGGLATGCA
jgi:hypothetical protein